MKKIDITKNVKEINTRDLLYILDNMNIENNKQALFYIDVKAEYSYRQMID